MAVLHVLPELPSPEHYKRLLGGPALRAPEHGGGLLPGPSGRLPRRPRSLPRGHGQEHRAHTLQAAARGVRLETGVARGVCLRGAWLPAWLLHPAGVPPLGRHRLRGLLPDGPRGPRRVQAAVEGQALRQPPPAVERAHGGLPRLRADPRERRVPGRSVLVRGLGLRGLQRDGIRGDLRLRDIPSGQDLARHGLRRAPVDRERRPEPEVRALPQGGPGVRGCRQGPGPRVDRRHHPRLPAVRRLPARRRLRGVPHGPLPELGPHDGGAGREHRLRAGRHRPLRGRARLRPAGPAGLLCAGRGACTGDLRCHGRLRRRRCGFRRPMRPRRALRCPAVCPPGAGAGCAPGAREVAEETRPVRRRLHCRLGRRPRGHGAEFEL
mmetsp:Transcript_33428/g.104156  ORF Transcript_33428/g.104156 Transcript_33428/m.104156 type:complete len:380 (+) Transcript_33428:575-1714(+)